VHIQKVMKLATLVFASVVGVTLLTAAGTANADRWHGRGWGHVGYGVRAGWVAPRVVVRPSPVYVGGYYEPGYVDPGYDGATYVEPTYVPRYIAPRVVVRPRPIIVRRGFGRRW
jgi:hypothetical protein